MYSYNINKPIYRTVQKKLNRWSSMDGDCQKFAFSYVMHFVNELNLSLVRGVSMCAIKSIEG